VTTLSTPEAARLPAHTETLTYAQLALVTIARLALTTAYRILYPLLPFLSQQLDVDLRTVTVLVTVQLMASLASPLGGMLADTRGERNTMVFGLGLFCSGAFLCAVADDFRGFLFGYALIGLAMTLYLPAAQSYLSQRTPYSRRGVTLGIFEIAWAAAALIGVAPLMQLVQTTGSTQPVFWLLLLFGIGSLALIRFMLPPTARRVSNGARGGIEWRALRDQSVLAMLSLWFLTMFSYDLFAVAQSAWLKQKYSASEAQLGQLFGVIGAAELIGSLLVVFLVDRIGKRRAVAGGFLLTALAMAALPLAGGSWALLIPLYFLFFLCMEFAIVAAIPLSSSLAPLARGTVLALIVTVNGVSRVLGSLASVRLWDAAGIAANTTLGASIIGLSVLLLLLVKEREE
jgi:predicted MFS family arabinose efflux permease